MVSRRQIQTLADEIAVTFPVEKIILFGSHAYGTPGEDSDVDLLVLMDFEGRAREAARTIARAVSHEFPRDLIVRTPADAKRRYDQFDPIIRHAFNTGIMLYERSRPGMVG